MRTLEESNQGEQPHRNSDSYNENLSGSNNPLASDTADLHDVESQPVDPKKPDGACCCSRSFWLKLVIFKTLLATVMVLFLVVKAHKKFPDLLDWIESNKVEGFFTFVVVYALSTIFFVPGVLLAFGGGFVFGLPLGTLSVWLGATLGQTVAFALGRFLFQECMSTKAQTWKLWRAIEHMTNEQGWKIVALLRLAPIIPYDALNYAFGLTAIHFWEYFIASSLSIIPGVFMFVYFGHIAGCIAKCANGDSSIKSETLFISIGVSCPAIIIVVALGTFYAKKSLKKLIEEDSVHEIEDGKNIQASENKAPVDWQ